LKKLSSSSVLLPASAKGVSVAGATAGALRKLVNISFPEEGASNKILIKLVRMYFD
jgi:hypothetical protein